VAGAPPAVAGPAVLTVAPARPAARLSRLQFLALVAYWVAIGYLWQSLGTLILPDAVEHLVGSAAKGTGLSVLEGIGTVIAIVWQPVAGTLSDRSHTRWGRRRPYLVGGTAADPVFLVGLALAGGFWPLVVAYTLLQFSSNTAQGPYQGLAPDIVPEEQRGTVSGFYGLANLLGILGGTVGGGLILAAAGRPAAVASIMALLAFGCLATVLGVKEPVRPLRPGGVGPFLGVVRATFLTPLAHRDFIWLMASRLLILMGVVGIQSFVLYYFSDTYFHGSTRAATGATTGLIGAVILIAVAVTWPAARLSDRVGRKALIVVGGLLAAAGVSVLLFSGYRWLPEALLDALAGALALPPLAAQTLLAGVLLGLGFGAFMSVDWAYITDVIPLEQAGLFFGFSNIATAGSGVIARFVAGFLLDHFNAGGRLLNLPGGYPVVFTLLLAWILVGTLFVLPVQRGRKR